MQHRAQDLGWNTAGDRRIPRRFAAACLLLAGAAVAAAQPALRPPVIRHAAPRTALRGQPLVLRAQVTAGAAPIQAVTLYGTSSRDAAPYPLRMTAAGAGAYVVTVPADVLGAGEEFTYYIEAMDTLETAGETPWYTVRLRAPSAPDAPVPLTDPDTRSRRERAGWVAPVAIAGGAALVVGGVALANRDSGSPGSAAPTPGRFTGSVIRVLSLGESTIESHGFTLILGEDQRVRSENLHPGRRLEGPLMGSTFVLTTDVTVDGMQGQIRYSGTVAGDQVAGSIDGEVNGADGRRGTFSGSFTATRQ